ncbi:MAG: PorV/PorQ family protein [bacterium]
MRRFIIYALVLGLIIVGLGFAQEDEEETKERGATRSGTAGAQYLKIGIGARAVALSDSIVALVDDSTATYWNPAGLAYIEGTDFTFSDVEWLADVRVMNGTFGHKFGFGTIGGIFTLVNMGEMIYRTVDKPEGEGTFKCQDMVIGGSYARWLIPQFAFGGTVKYIREKIADYSASGLAFDVGLIYITGFKTLKMGIAITNFGPDMRYGGFYEEQQRDKQTDVKKKFEPFSLPVAVRLGIAYTFFEGNPTHNLTVSADTLTPGDGQEKLSVGAEYWIKNMLALRAGYFIEAGKFREFNPRKFSFGAGVKLSKIRVDYAYTNYGDLESMVHRFTFGAGF